MKNNIFKKFNEDENFRNRIILFFVLIIGVVALILNFKNLGNIMSNSLKDKDEEALKKAYAVYNELKNSGKLIEDNTTKNNNTNTNADNNVNTEIKNDGTDTDGDGISDYDEINIFGTSMYLKDSDGDGISDDKEIKNGTNPNCAEGTKCDITTVGTINTPNISYGYGTNNSIDINSLDINKVRQELKNIAPDSVKSMVDTMTDDQVRTVFKQLYESQNSTTSNNTNSSTNYIDELKKKLPEFTPQQISMMKDMEESEIIDILVESGIVDKTFLSQFKSGEIKNTVLNNN